MAVAVILNLSTAQLGLILTALGIAVALLTWAINERQKKRSVEREKLKVFLRPLESRLRDSAKIADELRGSLADLEFPHLVEYFDNLPKSDARKYNWRERMARLHSLNNEAVELINDQIGLASSPLRAELNAFKAHAMQWEDMWKAVNDGRTPGSPEVRVPPFPRTVITSLQREIAQTERGA